MRLIVWNCFGKSPSAVLGHLAALEPDVVVAPELRPQADALPDGITFVWEPVLADKGFGAIGRGPWTVQRSPERGRLPWILPIEVSGPRSFTLLSIWTVRGSVRKLSYAKQVAEAIDAYRDKFADGNTVLAGDLNCSIQGVSPGPAQHLRNLAELESLGMVSTYHASADRTKEAEEPGTLYFQWKEDRPFHCDFAFIPEAWTPDLTHVTIGRYDQWVTPRISDHVPVVVDISDVGI